DEPRADAVLRIGHSVFENVNRFAKALRPLDGTPQSQRISLTVRSFPRAVPLRNVRWHEQPSKSLSGMSEIKSHMEAAVNVQAHEIAGTFHVACISIKHAQGKRKLAILHQAQKALVEELVHQGSDPAIRPTAYGFQCNIVVSPSD